MHDEVHVSAEQHSFKLFSSKLFEGGSASLSNASSKRHTQLYYNCFSASNMQFWSHLFKVHFPILERRVCSIFP